MCREGGVTSVHRNTLTRTLAHELIPGGAHTYSKGDDQFPSNAPRHLDRGEGPWVWDADGRRYLDWTMGLRSMSLGYGCAPVVDAAIDQIRKGTNFARPALIETELAQDLVDLIPSAEMVKFAKNGSTATTAAVKLARVFTGRDKVALCRDHPFYSYDDWAIAATAMNAGIPESTKRLTLTFGYNDPAGLETLFRDHPDEIACVILEPATTEPPADGYLQRVRALCSEHGAVMILDEMITGFRWHLSGAQTYFDVIPDLCTFGKGMGAGFSVAALVGRREIMELGGLFHDGPRVFLVSTTHGAETHSLAAARAALRIFREEPVIDHMWCIGDALIDGLNRVARDAGLGDAFEAYGFACSPAFVCRDGSGAVSLPLRTLFLQEMVRAGVIMAYVAPSYAHTEASVDLTIEAARRAFVVYRRGLEEGWQDLLEGPPIQPVFRVWN